jgi:hypothetical protein
VVGSERVPEPPDALVVLHFIPGLGFQEVQAAHALLRFRRVFARDDARLRECAGMSLEGVTLRLAEMRLP